MKIKILEPTPHTGGVNTITSLTPKRLFSGGSDHSIVIFLFLFFFSFFFFF